MAQLSPKLRSVAHGDRPAVSFWCPGCEEMHSICVDAPTGWKWDGNADRPTFEPSIKVTYRHPKGHTNENPAPVGRQGEYVEDVCHSFISAGRIEFLSDCTHSLAAQTVDLPDIPE